MGTSKPSPAEAQLPATGTGQGGPATSAQLAQPRNVALDADGSLYISDFGANQVYKVTTNGTLSLVAGTGAAGFSGVGTSALLGATERPAGLAVDSGGAIYFADSGNNRVRKVYNGVIITVFTTPGPHRRRARLHRHAVRRRRPAISEPLSNRFPASLRPEDLTLDPAGDHLRHFGGVCVGDPAGAPSPPSPEAAIRRTSAAMAGRLHRRNCTRPRASQWIRPATGTSPTLPTIASAW